MEIASLVGAVSPAEKRDLSPFDRKGLKAVEANGRSVERCRRWKGRGGGQ